MSFTYLRIAAVGTALVAAMFSHAAAQQSARKSYFHPTLRMAIEQPDPKRWSVEINKIDFGLGCLVCGKGADTWIFIYPSTDGFADINATLADITTYFEKEESLKIGEVRREAISDGEIAWTEQPGSKRPFLGAVKHGSDYFFLQMSTEKTMIATNNDLRADFLAAARSVRIWNGR